MTMPDLKELREKAEAATGTERRLDGYGNVMPAPCVASPATVLALIDRIESAERIMRELADDVAARVANEYPADARDRYPSQRRRYERDMQAVAAARAHFQQNGDANDRN